MLGQFKLRKSQSHYEISLHTHQKGYNKERWKINIDEDVEKLESSSFFFQILFIFSQMGRVGEREGEKHQYVVVSHNPLLGTWPTTQACALTGN